MFYPIKIRYVSFGNDVQVYIYTMMFWLFFSEVSWLLGRENILFFVLIFIMANHLIVLIQIGG